MLHYVPLRKRTRTARFALESPCRLNWSGKHRLRLPGPSIFLVIGVKVIATIALVDDDRNILTSVSIALEGEGYRVQTYTDGVDARLTV